VWRVRFERHAQGPDLVDFGADERPGEAVFRNPEPNHPAGLRRGVEDRDRVSKQRQIVGGGEAGRAGADDRHMAAAASGRRRQRRAPMPGQGQVGAVPIAFGQGGVVQPLLGLGTRRLDSVLLAHEPLERADGNGRVHGSPAAGVFTGRGADPATDRGQRIGGARHEVRLFVPSLGDQLDVAPGVGRDRASGLTFDLGLPVFDGWQGNLHRARGIGKKHARGDAPNCRRRGGEARGQPRDSPQLVRTLQRSSSDVVRRLSVV
jgi:hypothetical protein